jgi:hypothetical protein
MILKVSLPRGHLICFWSSGHGAMPLSSSVKTGFSKGSASAPKPRAGLEGLASTFVGCAHLNFCALISGFKAKDRYTSLLGD